MKKYAFVLFLAIGLAAQAGANQGYIFNMKQVSSEVDCSVDANVASATTGTGYVVFEPRDNNAMKVWIISVYKEKEPNGVTRKYYEAYDPLMFGKLVATFGNKTMWVLSFENANNRFMLTGLMTTIKIAGQSIPMIKSISGYTIWDDTEDGLGNTGAGKMTMTFNLKETVTSYTDNNFGSNGTQLVAYLIAKLEAQGYQEADQ